MAYSLEAVSIMAADYWSRRLRDHFFGCRQEAQRENELKGKAANQNPPVIVVLPPAGASS